MSRPDLAVLGTSSPSLPASLSAAYGLASYLFFFVSFLYWIGFVGGLPLPRAVDDGPAAPPAAAAVIDLALVAVFGLQHSLMARQGFKRAWTRVVPRALERSTYVLASTLALLLIVWQWRPIAQPLAWSVSGLPATILQGLFWLGWGVLLASSFMLDHFELFGLRQSVGPWMGLRETAPEFRTPMLYRHVRHPIYLGALVGFWATPRMTAGHLLLAAGFTAYVMVGIRFEERDLVALFGTRYAEYRRRVGMLWPRSVRK